MRYWKFKAYNVEGQISTGIIDGAFDEIVLKFRQNGWQIFELVPISKSEFNRLMVVERRLLNLHKLTVKPLPVIRRSSNKLLCVGVVIIILMLSWLLSRL